MLSHDTEHSLEAVVDLVNTCPSCNCSEGLPDPDSLRRFVSLHHISGIGTLDDGDVTSVHRVRALFRAIFGLDDLIDIANRLNALLSQGPVAPRLTDHDAHCWHLHYFAPNARLDEHLAVDGGMAVAQLVTAEETDRLRVCAAPDCGAVLLDLSRNHSKRYCDARSCGNRINVAAYRERKRSGLEPVGSGDQAERRGC